MQYNFEGRYDLVKFIKTAQKAGLFVHLRIGPYICGEWNFGYVFTPHHHSENRLYLAYDLLALCAASCLVNAYVLLLFVT